VLACFHVLSVIMLHGLIVMLFVYCTV
jgi:hypothetical protein